MSGRASRRKGKTGELEVVAELARHGLTVRRTPNSGGLAWRGDLQGLEGFLVEVKRRETLSVPAWLRQAHAAARAGEVPVVMFRRSAAGNASQRAPDTLWHVIEPLDSWAARVARDRGHARCGCGVLRDNPPVSGGVREDLAARRWDGSVFEDSPYTTNPPGRCCR